MKKIISLLTIIGIIIITGTVSATSFTAPLTTPPGGVITPIHTGISQVKTGSLSVNTFLANALANFNQQVYINNSASNDQKGFLRGSADAGSNLGVVVVGGIIEGDDQQSQDDDLSYHSSFIGSGRITTNRFFRSANIAHNSTGDTRPLCADSEGTIVLCGTSGGQVDICLNIEGVQTVPPVGMIREGNNCVWPVQVPALAFQSVSASMRPVRGGTLDDHYECAVTLNRENDTGGDMYVAVQFQYNFLGSGNPNFTQDCYVYIPNGQSVGISTPEMIDPAAQIQSQCIISEYPTDARGALIPASLSC